MITKVRMADGIELMIYCDVRTFSRASRKALKKKMFLGVVTSDGVERILNPAQILYFNDYKIPDEVPSELGLHKE